MPGKRRKTENETNPGQDLPEEMHSWLRNAYAESQLGLDSPLWVRISLSKESNGKCRLKEIAKLASDWEEGFANSLDDGHFVKIKIIRNLIRTLGNL